jgi:hypothetical protein
MIILYVNYLKTNFKDTHRIMAYFSSQFKTQKNAVTGGMMYIFNTIYTQTSENRNEEPPIYVEGMTISDNWDSVNNKDVFKLPEEILNPSVTKRIYERWLQDCSGCFVKPPTLVRFLINVKNTEDEKAHVAGLTQEEEDEEWIIVWIPTKVVVDMPNFEIHWSPSYKIRKTTRIPEFEEKLADDPSIREISLKEPQRGYDATMNDTARLLARRDHGAQSDRLQEISDLVLPFSDSPTLRLEIDQDLAREKYRKRVREARLKAKLARYRAERIAQRYEERYGVYPEEDEEEAQTEVDQSDEE